MPANTKVFTKQVDTHSELYTAITRAMELAGYANPTEVINSTSRNYYFPLQPEGVSYSLHLEIEVKNTLSLRQRLVKDWSLDSTSFSSSSWSDPDRPEGGDYYFVCCNHPELRVVLAKKNARTPFILGTLRPSSKENWWDESKYPFFFFSKGDDSNLIFRGFNGSLSPLPSSSAEDFSLTYFSELRLENPITKKRECITGLFLFDFDSDTGVCGTVSTELGRAAANSLSAGTLLIESPENMFMLLSEGTSGLVLATNWPEDV